MTFEPNDDLQRAKASLTIARLCEHAGRALQEGHDGKFFSPLRHAGANLVAVRPFPDHHAYTAREIDELLREGRDRDDHQVMDLLRALLSLGLRSPIGVGAPLIPARASCRAVTAPRHERATG